MSACAAAKRNTSCQLEKHIERSHLQSGACDLMKVPFSARSALRIGLQVDIELALTGDYVVVEGSLFRIRVECGNLDGLELDGLAGIGSGGPSGCAITEPFAGCCRNCC